MIRFGVQDMAETIKLAKQAAEECSKIFEDPIKLQFEKVYYPYLLLNKKRYAGVMWTNPDKPDKKDIKGVEAVRRDYCLLATQLVNKVLDILLMEQNVNKAVDHTRGVIYNLLNHRIDY